MAAGRIDAEYVLPLRWRDDSAFEELTEYLARVSGWVPVTVVDGSPQGLFDRHHEAWSGLVRHVPPIRRPGGNGKVAGVMTGVALARHERVVIADDDVRYDHPSLERLVAALAGADVVRPQNFYDELPWQARWDTARSLVNRAVASDFPGTLGVRRDLLLDAGGYDGDVLFENLELIRTVRAMGGREERADGLYVARRPPSVRHFAGQRVRQAYDGFAQPLRLMAELAVLPLALRAARRPRRLIVGALLVCAVAERGRRRDGGSAVFPASVVLWAPAWVLERGVCAWLAVLARSRGGVGYAGSRLYRAATSQRRLERRLRHDRHGREEEA